MSRHLLIVTAMLMASACSKDAEQSQAEAVATEHAEEGSNRVVLSETAYEAAQIRVAPVHLDSAAVGEDLEVPGQVEFDPRRVAVISTRIPGRMERVLVVEGDRVRATEVVAQLYSPVYVTAQNDFVQARRRAAALASTADSSSARSIAEAARRRLALHGVSDAAIERIETTGAVEEHLALEAPFAGTILDARVLSGQAVEAGQELFRLADLTVVDVVADVPERALPMVRVGQDATIAITAYPGMEFTGRVERLRGELNPETRTVRAVIHANNRLGRLRPGMFATVRLAGARTARSEPVLTIPESAIVTDGERRYVFVEVGLREFERRVVDVRSLAPPGSALPVVDRVAVRRGLTAGERVVVAGAFTLKSELAKASLGEEH